MPNRESDQKTKKESLIKYKKNTQSTCKCRDSNICPLDGKCVTEYIMYKTTARVSVHNKKGFISTEGTV